MRVTRLLVTTLGDLRYKQVGWMLAHEHIFANFAENVDCGVDTAAVVERIVPELEHAKAVGFTALVEATAIGAARRLHILRDVSRAAQFPVVAATGWFKEPAKHDWVLGHSESELTEWMCRELTEEIGTTGVRAGWIKLSVADNGIQPHEKVLLRAAAAASQRTNAVVGCHTVGAKLANAVLDNFQAAGGDPSRFIWIHTQTEPSVVAHMAFARRGAWIEYDAIDDNPADKVYLDWICRLLDTGAGDHLLLSHDRVGYNPTQENGGTFKPYSYLAEHFLPKLRQRGVDDAVIEQLLRKNPFRAYAR